MTVLLLCLLALIPSTSHAATNDLTALLQQGLFEEQASRNLDAAIADYQTLAAQFDKDRQLAATAVFRLGECYRAQGNTNQAAVQYQRILRDFSDQPTLATLSRQNLAGMGMDKPEYVKAEIPAAVENPEAQLLKKLETKSEADLEKLLPTLMPDTTLDALLKQRYEIQVQRALLAVDYATNNINVARADASLERLDVQIKEKIAGMMQALKLRADMAPTASVSKRSDLADLQVPSEEDQEIARIQQMIQNSPDLINAPGEGGATPLQSAAALGRLKVVNYLLDHGAAINAGSFPALNRAADAGNRAMVELLLSRGAQADAPEANGQTALHHAAAHGYLSVVEALLAAKPDVNAIAMNHRTPLTLAVEARAVFVATTLLAHGADPNNISVLPYGNNDRKENGTPLHVAVALNDAAMVTLLLTNHSDLTLRNKTGESALDIAAILGETAIARQLIAAGADVNAISPDNYGPLHYAAVSGSRAVVSLLLEHGANPNARNKSGATPLMSAVLSNNRQNGLDVISVLLQYK
ncbi:MAG: ankyrin repeat domain-containing protein, partial [Verrucomicrobia bacterium]|nr:ankyrin repeat domain-containing protein [Verrucomicrobiota bacterium]